MPASAFLFGRRASGGLNPRIYSRLIGIGRTYDGFLQGWEKSHKTDRTRQYYLVTEGIGLVSYACLTGITNAPKQSMTLPESTAAAETALTSKLFHPMIDTPLGFSGPAQRATASLPPHHPEHEPCDPLLTKKQLASLLNLPSTRGVDELVRRRVIPIIRLGRKTNRFRWADVLAAISRMTIQPLNS